LTETAIRQGEGLERKIAGGMYSEGWFVGGKKPGNYPSRDIDVLIPTLGAWHRVEIKDESNYAESANIVVETYQGNPRHPSGIMTSESTICLHYLSESKIVIYKTNSMRLWLPVSGLVESIFRKADNSNGGYIVPIAKLPAGTWNAVTARNMLFTCGVWGLPCSQP
jgi:hypothetical protein